METYLTIGDVDANYSKSYSAARVGLRPGFVDSRFSAMCFQISKMEIPNGLIELRGESFVGILNSMLQSLYQSRSINFIDDRGALLTSMLASH